jgi:hypothetical protein
MGRVAPDGSKLPAGISLDLSIVVFGIIRPVRLEQTEAAVAMGTTKTAPSTMSPNMIVFASSVGALQRVRGLSSMSLAVN